jgi:hypothetical protein
VLLKAQSHKIYILFEGKKFNRSPRFRKPYGGTKLVLKPVLRDLAITMLCLAKWWALPIEFLNSDIHIAVGLRKHYRNIGLT